MGEFQKTKVGKFERKCFILLRVSLILIMIQVQSTSQSKRSHNHEQSLRKAQAVPSPRYLKSNAQNKSARVCNTRECVQIANTIRSSMNLTVDPCQDFYEYVCGRWPINNPLPNGKSKYDNFDKLTRKVQDYFKNKLETRAINITGINREIRQMPSDMYTSCVDLTAIDRVGDVPLRTLIDRLGGWDIGGLNQNWNESRWNFTKVIQTIHREYKSENGPLFAVRTLTDPSDTKQNAVFIFQGGPKLGKEEYSNLASKNIQAYKTFIMDVLELLGANKRTLPNNAQEIVNFEAQLANISLSQADFFKEIITSGTTLGNLGNAVPEFDWISHLNAVYAPYASFKADEQVQAPSLAYLKKVMKLIKITPKSVLANYLVWFTIQDEIQHLSRSYRDVYLRYQQATIGTQGQQERWDTCVSYTKNFFKDVMAAAYVHDHYTQIEEIRNMVQGLVNDVRRGFRENIDSLSWIDNTTKAVVFEKLEAMEDFIGYPDFFVNSSILTQKFQKYNNLVITNDAYFTNNINLAKLKHQKMFSDLRKPINKQEGTFPHEVNVWYKQSHNWFVLSASLLHPPFFYPNELLRALNLGALGFFIGHEMTHGFDTIGRSFDKNGNPVFGRSLWTRKSIDEFNTRLQCYVKQYSQYKIAGKYPINSRLTLNENIADNGGIKAALKAFKIWSKKNTRKRWLLPGLNFTSEQLFYIGFGQELCSQATPQKQYTMSLFARHTYSKFRVIGSLSNSLEFAKAFKCKKNSPMNPDQKCALWSEQGSVFY